MYGVPVKVAGENVAKKGFHLIVDVYLSEGSLHRRWNERHLNAYFGILMTQL